MPYTATKTADCLSLGDVFTSPNIKNGKQACLVVDTGYSGGGYGHGPHDEYPNGYEVTYVELPASAMLSRKAVPDISALKRRSFYQTGAFSNMIDPRATTLLGSMKLKVVTTARWTRFPKKK